MKILVTAFEAFGGKDLNASILAIDGLTEYRREEEWMIETMVLPVKHHDAGEQLVERLNLFQPDITICFGEAGGRSKVSIERIAINFCDFSIPDNAGTVITDETIIMGATTAFFSTLPMRAIWEGLLMNGIPAEISLSAGAYLCNEVFFALMNYLANQHSKQIGGFIHLPILPAVAAVVNGSLPSMSESMTQAAARLIIDECAGFYNASVGNLGFVNQV